MNEEQKYPPGDDRADEWQRMIGRDRTWGTVSAEKSWCATSVIPVVRRLDSIGLSREVDLYIGHFEIATGQRTILDREDNLLVCYEPVRVALDRLRYGAGDMPERTEIHFEDTEQDARLLAGLRNNALYLRGRCFNGDGWIRPIGKSALFALLCLTLFLPAQGCGGASTGNVEAPRTNCAGDRLPPTPDTRHVSVMREESCV